MNGSNDSISGSASREQTWTLDALGNWSTLTQTGGGSTENKTYNRQNQITNSGFSYDANGNLKKTTSGTTAPEYIYDAWNRMVEFKSTGSSYNASRYEYPFDALGRRVKEELTYSGGGFVATAVADQYHSNRWQVIAEKFEGYYEPAQVEGAPVSVTTTSTTSYVWSPGYVDELIERDQSKTVSEDYGEGPVDTNTSTRLYVQQDHNFNVTSLTDATGAVVERFIYDPYGAVSVLTNNYQPTTTNYDWVYLHQGGRLNTINGTYHFRNRDYSPTLGRWLQQDPAGYVDGASLYQAVVSSPVSWVDPEGALSVKPDSTTHLAPGWRADRYTFNVEVIGDGYLGDNSSNPQLPHEAWPTKAFTGTIKVKVRGFGAPLAWIGTDEQIRDLITEYLVTPANELPGNAQAIPRKGWLPSTFDLDFDISVHLKDWNWTFGLTVRANFTIYNVGPRQ